MHGWPLTFLIFSPPFQKFILFFQQKKMSPLFFISRIRSLSLFFSLSFAGLPPTFSFSLSGVLLYIPNLWSKLNTLDSTDTETISTFRSRLYWLFSCLCITRRGWLCDCPPKYPRVAFGLPYLLIELFKIGMPVVRTERRSVSVRAKGVDRIKLKINIFSSKFCEK